MFPRGTRRWGCKRQGRAFGEESVWARKLSLCRAQARFWVDVRDAWGRGLDGRRLQPAAPAFCCLNVCSTFSLKRRFFCLILASSALRLASKSGS